MIYELRTYNLRPGSVQQLEANVGEALPYREKFSRLGAFWHTDVGPMHQVVHIWPYESHAERVRIRDEAAVETRWPPRTDGAIQSGVVEIYLPAPFMPAISNRAMGNIYEMCISTYRSGSMREVLKRWAECIPDRIKHSALAVGMYSELAGLNTWIHIWPYKNYEERNRVREEASKGGHWPPRVDEFLVREESKLLIPAAFSPLH